MGPSCGSVVVIVVPVVVVVVPVVVQVVAAVVPVVVEVLDVVRRRVLPVLEPRVARRDVDVGDVGGPKMARSSSETRTDPLDQDPGHLVRSLRDEGVPATRHDGRGDESASELVDELASGLCGPEDVLSRLYVEQR